MNRAALAGAGLTVTSAVAIAGQGMTGHMAAHTAAVAIAAPLFAIGLRRTATDPARRWQLAASPLAMSLAELAVVWLWHVPALRDAAGHGAGSRLVELLCFLAAGWLLWSAVLAPAPAARAAGVGALLLTSMHMTLLGALIALAPRPLYPAMAHEPPFGLTALADQQLGGTVMLTLGGAIYLLGGLAVLAGLLRREGRTA